MQNKLKITTNLATATILRFAINGQSYIRSGMLNFVAIYQVDKNCSTIGSNKRVVDEGFIRLEKFSI